MRGMYEFKGMVRISKAQKKSKWEGGFSLVSLNASIQRD